MIISSERMPEPVSILLVDDDDKNLTVLETILDSPDYRLIKASSADETLLVLMREECAAIVMDVKMPDMSGIELAKLIKQRKKTQDIPILFLSAHYYEDEHIVLGYGAGAVDYITKPVNPAVLRSKISVFVELFRKTTALAQVNNAMEAEIQDRQKAEERFRLVVEAAPNAMIVFTQDGRITLVNSRTESLFGYSRGELLDQAVAILVPDGLPEARNEELPDALDNFPAHELLGRRKDGGRVPLEAVFSRFQSADGVFELASFVDITQRKQAEAALRTTNEELAIKNAELQRNAEDRARRIHAEAARAEAEAANNAKDRFLAMLSHELRTPLSPVLHAVALIEEDNSPPNIKELLETIRRNVQLEARLIDDLLDLSRIRHGKLQLHLENVDIHELLRRAVQICEPEVNLRNLEMKIDFSATATHLQGDSARLQQIFWNLINNAVKYTPSEGNISIATADSDKPGHIRVSFADSGIGISSERLGKIFGAFEQAHGDRSTGLGLGLAICRALAEMHGGSIEVASGGPGEGSRFTVELPVTVNLPSAAAPLSSPAQSSVTPLRILLVEDHTDTATALRRLLVKRGHKVQSAPNVTSAIQSMRDYEFDVLVSDIGLPDGRGLELMPFFLKSAGERPVAGVAVSGYGMPEDIQRSRDAGFSDHLTKPVDISRLQKVLAELSSKISTSPDVAATREG